jgi:hypothetical protein
MRIYVALTTLPGSYRESQGQVGHRHTIFKKKRKRCESGSGASPKRYTHCLEAHVNNGFWGRRGEALSLKQAQRPRGTSQQGCSRTCSMSVPCRRQDEGHIARYAQRFLLGFSPSWAGRSEHLPRTSFGRKLPCSGNRTQEPRHRGRAETGNSTRYAKPRPREGISQPPDCPKDPASSD